MKSTSLPVDEVFFPTCVPIWRCECRNCHLDVHKFLWCEINYRSDGIVAAFITKSVKRKRVCPRFLIGFLIFVGSMIGNFVDMLTRYVGQHSHGASQILDG